jgi:pimeloyl-ACP methyl ester carboxylesterase
MVVAGCATPPATPPSVQPVAAAGTTFATVSQGSGTPMVFVHGAGGDWRTWEPLRPFISPSFRFVSYSRRYHHPNDPAGGGRDYTVPEQANDLIAFVQALGAGAVHVVGGSYGARVALEAAVRRPDLFRTVVASEAFITPPTDPAAQPAARALAEDLGRIGIPMRQGDTVGATVQLVKAVTGQADGWDRLAPDARQRFLDNQASWIPLARAPQVPSTSCEALGKLPMPVLVMEGERTVAGFRVTNDRLMQCLPPTARRAVVPGAPHMWYPANPAAASKQILDFVAASQR